MSRTRVLLCAPNLSRGGAERMSLQLLESLDRARFDVTMHLQELEEGQLDPGPRAADIVIGRRGPYRRSHLPGHLLRLLRLARRADVIVGVSEGRAAALALLCGRLTGRPVVLWLHADWSRFAGVLSWRTRAAVGAFRHARAIVACSGGVARAHAEAFPGNRPLLRVIPNAIDVDAIAAAAAAPLPSPLPAELAPLLEGPTIVAAGRLDPQKGFDLLIEAHARALVQGPAHRLVILGTGEARPALERLARDLGVAGSVSFAGFQDNPHRIMARASLFVLSSRFEGFGLVLAEALACGCPVLSFDCPSGPAEILREGRDGVLVPPEDAGALADAIAALLADPQRRAELAEIGPRRARAYDLPAFAAAWGDLLEEVAGRGR